jgi:PAS domain S-box-containing protein
MSFRLKTILGVALIEAILLILLIVSGVRMVRTSGGEQFEKRAASTAGLFAAMVTDAVLSTDLASLEVFVKVVSSAPDVVYARIYRSDSLLAEAGEGTGSQPGGPYDVHFDDSSDGIFDTSAAIEVAGRVFGRVEIGLSTAQVTVLADTARRQGTLLAIIEMLLVAAFSFALGTLLTRELDELEHGAQQVAEGNLGYQLRERGKDELGRVARAFNVMSRRVDEAYGELQGALEDEQRLGEELRDSRTHFQTVLESAVDGIITIDARGRVETFNAAAERIFGHERQEVVGKNVKMLMPAEFADEHDEYIARYLSTRQARIIGTGREVTGLRSDGSTFPMDLSVSEMRFGEQHFFNALVRDVTEQKAIQTALRAFSRQMKAIFELSADGFVVLDRGGQVSYTNPAFSEMSGFATDDLVGLSQDQFDTVLRGLCDRERTYVACDGLEDGAVDTLHMVRPRPSILLRSHRRTQSKESDAEERVFYFRDVTQEAEVDRLKSEFLSTAAHELRTPLTSIHGFTELLLSRDYSEDMRREILQTVYKQSSSLVGLVSELLDLARIEARAGKDFEIKARPFFSAIEDVAVAVSATKGETHSVSLQLPLDPVGALFDKEKFGQALTNVLTNAFKYSPDGGTIEITAGTRTYKGEEQVGVRVQDPGIGMSDTVKERLFERFFRADSSGSIPGTGLGMSLVKEVMDIHRGSVEVDSTVGEGTVVTLWLPKAVSLEEVKVE